MHRSKNNNKKINKTLINMKSVNKTYQTVPKSEGIRRTEGGQEISLEGPHNSTEPSWR